MTLLQLTGQVYFNEKNEALLLSSSESVTEIMDADIGHKTAVLAAMPEDLCNCRVAHIMS